MAWRLEPPRQDVDHRGELPEDGAHGRPRRRRLARRQWSGCDPFRVGEDQPVPRVRTVLRREQVQQQDQRCHPEKMAAPVQPSSCDHHQQVAWQHPMGGEPRPAQRPQEVRRQCGPAEGVLGRQAREQGTPCQPHLQDERRQGPSGRPVRRPGQADPRVQAPAVEHPPGHPPLQPNQARFATGTLPHAASRVHLRWQGCSRLLGRQDDHPPHHRCRQGRERRQGRRGSPQGRLPRQLQRLPRRGHHPRQRYLRAHLDSRN
mmetsp:Transcript_8447/g.14523  ORF Transcript_8447/g.14523 Transcript_8447/m.14523 type:complete len:260 (+) Transcript_8447:1437-2216(+)